MNTIRLTCFRSDPLISITMTNERPAWEQAVILLAQIVVLIYIGWKVVRSIGPVDTAVLLDSFIDVFMSDPTPFALLFWVYMALMVGWWVGRFATKHKHRKQHSACENCGGSFNDQDGYYVESRISNADEHWCPHCVLEEGIGVS